MMATVRKLIVEVVDARNLQPKDGHGKSSPYATIDYHGQGRKTNTVIDNLNPTWNETLKFNVAKTPNAFGNLLELKVLHNKKFGPTTRNSLLGRVSLNSVRFVNTCENLSYYPLRKKKCWSHIHGEIGLKIYFVDELIPPPQAPNPPPTDAPASQPPEKTTPFVPPTLPAEAAPQYPYPYPPYPYPYPYPYTHTDAYANSYPWENRGVFSLCREHSYPEEDIYPTVSLNSIWFAFQLWFFLVCFIRF